MANIVWIIITNIAHTVYIWFEAFYKFYKFQFVLQIFSFYEISIPVVRHMLTMANIL